MVTDKTTLHPPTKEDVVYISDNLRSIDISELKDTEEYSDKSLIKAFDRGEVACIAKYFGRPMVAFCVAREPNVLDILTPKRYCWLNATNEVATAGVGVWLSALYNVRRVIDAYGRIYTFVRDDNKLATRFVKGLGFESGGKAYFNGNPATYWEKSN